MWYYVTWCLMLYVPAPCPEARGWVIDEFGRQNYQGAVCAVNHMKLEKDCGHVKRFDTRMHSRARIDAIEFYNDCKKQKDISELKIDSVEIPIEYRTSEK